MSSVLFDNAFGDWPCMYTIAHGCRSSGLVDKSPCMPYITARLVEPDFFVLNLKLLSTGNI